VAAEFERLSLVVSACNHPNCLVLPFRLELSRLAAWATCEVKGHSLAICVADHPESGQTSQYNRVYRYLTIRGGIGV
jgi:uncharacterized protein (DUF1786 family)